MRLLKISFIAAAVLTATGCAFPHGSETGPADDGGEFRERLRDEQREAAAGAVETLGGAVGAVLPPPWGLVTGAGAVGLAWYLRSLKRPAAGGGTSGGDSGSVR